MFVDLKAESQSSLAILLEKRMKRLELIDEPIKCQKSFSVDRLIY